MGVDNKVWEEGGMEPTNKPMHLLKRERERVNGNSLFFSYLEQVTLALRAACSLMEIDSTPKQPPK